MQPECRAKAEYNAAMTVRPVFIPSDKKPYYRASDVEFEWIPGQAASKRIENSRAIQSAWLKDNPGKSILEVSTKSELPLGQALSPFNLDLHIPSLRKAFPVENLFHGSKVFKDGGPYADLLGTTPLLAKRDSRLNDSGELVHFRLEDKLYPAEPADLFYNWLYIKALKRKPGLAKEAIQYDAFCDVEFNPLTGTNCQAKACAIYTSLARAGLLDQTDSFEDFKKLFLYEDITEIKEQSKRLKGPSQLSEMRKPIAKRRVFAPGQWIEHPGIGIGKVLRRNADGYVVSFRIAGPKTISKDFVETQCKPANPQ